jgi:hypothetical protein
MSYDTLEQVKQALLTRAARLDFPALVCGGVGLGPGEAAWRAGIGRAFVAELGAVATQLGHLEALAAHRRAQEPVRFEPNPDFEIPSIDADLLEALRQALAHAEARRHLEAQQVAEATIRALVPPARSTTR